MDGLFKVNLIKSYIPPLYKRLYIMPYDSIEAAKKAGFPTSAEEIDLTLAQINKLAEVYDAIKKAGTTDNPFAVAWTAWKKIYKKEGDKWVEIKKGNAETTGKWIPVAKANQTKQLGNGSKVILTEEALIRSLNSWKTGEITINHMEPVDGLKILGAKYETPFLYMQFDPNTEKLFRNTDATGWSVEFDPDSMQFDGEKIIDGAGVGVSILYAPHIPTCTPEMGCNETYAFEMYNEFEGKTLSAKNETELKAIAEDVKKGFERLWDLLKGITTPKENKKEGENQERKNLEKKKMEKVEELTSKLEATKTELVNKTSEFETATKAHEDEVKGYKEKIAEFEQKEADKLKAERDAQFEQIIAKLPPGMTHKEEDKTALRAKFDNDPTALMAELVAMERKEGTGEEGSEFELKQKEDVAAIKELKEDTGRI